MQAGVITMTFLLLATSQATIIDLSAYRSTGTQAVQRGTDVGVYYGGQLANYLAGRAGLRGSSHENWLTNGQVQRPVPKTPRDMALKSMADLPFRRLLKDDSTHAKPANIKPHADSGTLSPHPEASSSSTMLLTENQQNKTPEYTPEPSTEQSSSEIASREISHPFSFQAPVAPTDPEDDLEPGAFLLALSRPLLVDEKQFHKEPSLVQELATVESPSPETAGNHQPWNSELTDRNHNPINKEQPSPEAIIGQHTRSPEAVCWRSTRNRKLFGQPGLVGYQQQAENLEPVNPEPVDGELLSLEPVEQQGSPCTQPDGPEPFSGRLASKELLPSSPNAASAAAPATPESPYPGWPIVEPPNSPSEVPPPNKFSFNPRSPALIRPPPIGATLPPLPESSFQTSPTPASPNSSSPRLPIAHVYSTIIIFPRALALTHPLPVVEGAITYLDHNFLATTVRFKSDSPFAGCSSGPLKWLQVSLANILTLPVSNTSTSCSSSPAPPPSTRASSGLHRRLLAEDASCSSGIATDMNFKVHPAVPLEDFKAMAYKALGNVAGICPQGPIDSGWATTGAVVRVLAPSTRLYSSCTEFRSAVAAAVAQAGITATVSDCTSLQEQSSAGTNPPSAGSDGSKGKHTRKLMLVIVGAIIGAAVLAAVIPALFIMRRRKKLALDKDLHGLHGLPSPVGMTIIIPAASPPMPGSETDEEGNSYGRVPNGDIGDDEDSDGGFGGAISEINGRLPTVFCGDIITLCDTPASASVQQPRTSRAKGATAAEDLSSTSPTPALRAPMEAAGRSSIATRSGMETAARSSIAVRTPTARSSVAVRSPMDTSGRSSVAVRSPMEAAGRSSVATKADPMPMGATLEGANSTKNDTSPPHTSHLPGALPSLSLTSAVKVKLAATKANRRRSSSAGPDEGDSQSSKPKSPPSSAGTRRGSSRLSSFLQSVVTLHLPSRGFVLRSVLWDPEVTDSHGRKSEAEATATYPASSKEATGKGDLSGVMGVRTSVRKSGTSKPLDSNPSVELELRPKKSEGLLTPTTSNPVVPAAGAKSVGRFAPLIDKTRRIIDDITSAEP